MYAARRFSQCLSLIIACLAGAGLYHPFAVASPPFGEDNRQSLETALDAIERLKRGQERFIARARIREAAASMFLGLKMCQSAYRLLRFDPDDPAADPYIRARLYQTGVCVQRNPTAALRFLHQALDRPNIRALAYARLGEAYLTGQGLSQDFHRANHYFRLALFTRGWALADPFIRGENIELAALFGDVFEPSWRPPDRFVSTLEQLRAQLAQDPRALVGFALSHCDLDTPPCAYAAFDWIYATAKKFDYADAHYHYADLLLEPRISKARLAVRPISPGTSPSRTVRETEAAIALVKAGQLEHIPAIERLITLLRTRPRGGSRDKALYFWKLRLQRLEPDTTALERENFSSSLSRRQTESIQEMEKKITTCCLPPLDWHFPPQLGQPKD